MGAAWSIIGLMAIVVLILFLAYKTTQWIGTHSTAGFAAGTGASGYENFRVLGQIVLGQRERLVLVRLGDSCCLLGVTENQITVLKELQGEEAGEWLKEAGTPVSSGFLEVFTENLRKRK